jgi:hypothetical protein
MHRNFLPLPLFTEYFKMHNISIKIVWLLCCVAALQRAMAASSVLHSGYWVKVRIEQTGIHAISQKQAQQWGLGNIADMSVWGNGCGNLPRNVGATLKPIHTDLQQIPSMVDGDKLLFYAEAQHRWRYNAVDNFWEHELNEYSASAYVYLSNTQARTSIATTPATDNPNNTNNPDYVSSAYDYLAFHERNDTNLLQSGRRFWGEIFGVASSRTFSFNIPSPYDNSLKIKLSTAAKSSVTSNFLLQVNNGVASTLEMPATTGTDAFATEAATVFGGIPYSSENLNIKITYSRPDNNSTGFLDYITLNARSRLVVSGKQLIFRDVESVRHNCRFDILDLQASQNPLQVWDVSDIHQAKRMEVRQNGSTTSIFVHADTLKTFVAFTPAMAYTPQFVERVNNQDLQGMSYYDYVIIAPPAFAMQAQRLAKLYTDLHLPTIVVTTTQVDNQFSSGIPDPTSIRNYLITRKIDGLLPKYVLLFGSGSYVNMEGKHGVGLMPTYQSDNSLVEHLSFVSDDYFGLLDSGETLGEAGMVGSLDLAIGRLPAANQSEASVLVHKIEQHYATARTHSANQFVLIADDGDNNIHAQQTEDLAASIQDMAPAYPVNKIYFDKYPQTLTAIGKRYPAVTEAIASAVAAGALVINYVGHANTQWLSHEQTLTQTDIAQWTSVGGGRLPLFVTATCEFSRFDNHAQRSAGVNILLKPNGGGIAMLSTTRLVYSNGNAALNTAFMRQLFERGEDGQPLRLGEIVRRAKNAARTGVNQLNFTLLGDPALRLHLVADTLQSHSLTIDDVASDTLRALSRIKFTGTPTAANDGDTLEIAVYDKTIDKQTLGNGGQQPFHYKDIALIYKGLAVVENGSFEINFIVPKDIGYAYGRGKITYYGKCGNRYTGGAVPVVVGGVSDMAQENSVAPSIKLYVDNEHFVDGGTTSTTPHFIAIVEDESGMNLTGIGIGRNMTLHLTEIDRKYVLNSYYTAAVGGKSGRVDFVLPPLPKGMHTAVFKAFNVYNNSAHSSIRFEVVDEEKFTISRVYNFPNPFCEQTTFFVEHNRPEAEMQVEIRIFNTGGSLVRTLQYTIYGGDMQRMNNFAQWDGNEAYTTGIYIYKITARTKNGERAERTGKLLYLCTK